MIGLNATRNVCVFSSFSVAPQPLTPIQLSPVRTMTPAEEMRHQRNNEAKELIGSRVGMAKAIFNQNSASGQMLLANKAAPIKPVRNSIAQRVNTLNHLDNDETSSPTNVVVPSSKPDQNLSSTSRTADIDQSEDGQPRSTTETEPIQGHASAAVPSTVVSIRFRLKCICLIYVICDFDQQEQRYDGDDDQFSTIKRSPYSKQNSTNSQITTPVDAEPPVVVQSSLADTNRGVVIQNGKCSKWRSLTRIETFESHADIPSEDDIIYQDIMKDGGLKARALYDYQAGICLVFAPNAFSMAFMTKTR